MKYSNSRRETELSTTPTFLLSDFNSINQAIENFTRKIGYSREITTKRHIILSQVKR